MNRKPLELKDYLLISLICVLFGVFYLLAVYAGGILTGVLTPMGLGILGYEPFYGIWFMAPVFTLYLIRKPGIGILTEIIAALIEVVLGNMFGVIVLVSGFIQGLGIELAFLSRKYTNITYGTTMLGAVITTVFTFIWTGFRSNYLALDLQIVGAIFVIRLLSALFFTGYLSKLLCDRLLSTGVVKARG
ncbi:ECF transporter S component [Selenomonas sp. TAMA-11512]|uniref:ECF transporter S component n=1 Tax=Selenomonas sp. TAMA-11512 TaxID=3095337 RepID=UPI0030918695|nr:ECF transporter S component [Selenomonas sp. TAMA-11512]